MNDLELSLDMDGVLVDFSRGAHDLFGRDIGHLNKSHQDLSLQQKKEKQKLWITIRTNPVFWERLHPMVDAMELWDGVKHLSPVILTAAPSTFGESSAAFLEVHQRKENWIRHHLKIETENRFICTVSKKKQLFMNPDKKFNVLIDDRIDNITRWNAAGGIGILHTSAASSLEALKGVLGSAI